VTISVPEASRASRIVSFEENFPVPSMSREEKVRSAMMSGEVKGGTGYRESRGDRGRGSYGKLPKGPQKNLSEWSERFF